MKRRASGGAGQPRVLRRRDGRPIPMPVFDCVHDQIEQHALIARLARNGIGTFSVRTDLPIGAEELAPGVARAVARVGVLAEHAPDACLLLSLAVRPGPSWRRAHDDELTRTADGRYALIPRRFDGHYRADEVPPERIWNEAEPSVFSVRETRDYARAFRALFRALAKEPWGDRVVGAFLHKYVFGEWAVPHWYPDRCPPARRFVKRFLRDRYGTDDALQRAWGDPAARLADPRLPVRESIYHRLDVGQIVIESQAMRDYLEAEALALAVKFRDMCRGIKACGEHLVAGGFFGYGHPYQSEIRSVLDDDAIDFVCTPMEYQNRQPGGGVSSQSPYPDMPRVHGSVFFDELDTSTHVAPEIMNNVGRPRNRRESLGVVRRDLGQMILQGHAGWYLDFAGEAGHGWGITYRKTFPRRRASYYDDPVLLKMQRRIREVWDAAETLDRAPVAEVRIFYPRQNNRIAALGHAKRIETPMAGIPIEEHALGDLLEGRVEPARVNVLWWPVLLDTAERAALARRMETSERDWIVYGPGGLVDRGCAGVPDAERTADLAGFPVDLEWLREPVVLAADPAGRLARSRLRALPAYGQTHKVLRSRNVPWLPGGRDLRRDPLPVEPVQNRWRLSVREAPGVEVLARHGETGAPAVARRRTRAGGSVCLYALPVFNSELYRIFADWAGAHLYIEEDAYLLARRGLLLLHQARKGTYRVRLPGRPGAARDLWLDEPVPVRRGGVTLEGPAGTTHFLQLTPRDG